MLPHMKTHFKNFLHLPLKCAYFLTDLTAAGISFHDLTQLH